MSLYTLQQINDILFGGMEMTIKQEDVDNLKFICDEMDIPMKPVSLAPSTIIKHGAAKTDVQSVKWGQNRKVIASKQSFDHKLNVVKMNINKITDKNYDTLSVEIINVADDICQNGGEIEINYFSSAIFDIASNNRFYSHVFARLLARLSVHEKIRQTIHSNVDRFFCLFETIDYISPDENYELFCKNNKTNEKRKAISSFYTNLMKLNMIEQSTIMNMIYLCASQVGVLLYQDGQKHKVDELLENIYIIYSQCPELTHVQHPTIEDKSIFDWLLHVLRVKEYPSLSKKSIFKLMDMVDLGDAAKGGGLRGVV